MSINTYWNDLAVPLGIVAAAIVLGLIVERVVIGVASKFFERRGWTIGRRLVTAFSGIVTTWFGLAAVRAELHEFPLKASALPAIEQTISALFILAFAVLIARTIVAFIRTFSSAHEGAVRSVSLIENIVRAIVYALAILAILHAYGIAITPLLAALGVGGLAVALALQDTLGNFFAGIYIISSKYIDPGDYVKLDSGQEGTIRDIAWRVTTLETPSQTLIIIPNSKFSTSIITNFNRPHRSMELTIELPIDATKPARAFERTALEAAQEVKSKMPEVVTGEPKLQYTALSTTGVTLQLSIALSDFSKQNDVRHEIIERIYRSEHPTTTDATADATMDTTTSQKTKPPQPA